MKIICISDTHTLHRKMKHPIPDGDVIVHTGDFMSSGWDKTQYIPFLTWFNSLPHKHKIFIAGNHDRFAEMYNEEFRNDVKSLDNVTYLQDNACEIEGVKFYGSPWTKHFHNWAFNMPEENSRYEFFAENLWKKIPSDTNVLLTHGQPYKINDKAPDGYDTGCKYLLERIKELPALKLYVGGHIHCEHGVKEIDGVTFVNAAICNEEYEPVNAPIVYELN